MWTLTGIGPASFWARRRAHEAAVHLAEVLGEQALFIQWVQHMPF